MRNLNGNPEEKVGWPKIGTGSGDEVERSKPPLDHHVKALGGKLRFRALLGRGSTIAWTLLLV
jgi:hypothetical protein